MVYSTDLCMCVYTYMHTYIYIYIHIILHRYIQLSLEAAGAARPRRIVRVGGSAGSGLPTICGPASLRVACCLL